MEGKEVLNVVESLKKQKEENVIAKEEKKNKKKERKGDFFQTLRNVCMCVCVCVCVCVCCVVWQIKCEATRQKECSICHMLRCLWKGCLYDQL